MIISYLNISSKDQKILFGKLLVTYAYSELPKHVFHHFSVICKSHQLAKYLVRHANLYDESLMLVSVFLIYQYQKYGSAFQENILLPLNATNQRPQNLNHHDKRRLPKYPFWPLFLINLDQLLLDIV